MKLDPYYWRHWWAVHLRWWAGDAKLLFRRTFSEFSDDHCTQLAAGISYYVLFSIFPLAILVVSISGLILTNDDLRRDVVGELFEILPLDAEGEGDLEDAIDSVATPFSVIGLIGILGLLWSASGMMGALRQALNQAWDLDYRRPFLRGKSVDLIMVLSMGFLLALSIGSTIFLQVARRVSDDLSDLLGPVGAGATLSFEVVAVLVPLTFSFATFMFIFKFVPSVKTRFVYIWPGALLSAVLFEIVKNSFAFYLRNFGNFDAIYGSLGALIAFLFFVFISANIMLLGAEMAAEWPRVIHGHYDEDLARPGRAGSRRQRLRASLRALIHHEEEAPEHIDDTSAGESRRQRKTDEFERRLRERPSPRAESDASPDSVPPDNAPPDNAPPDNAPPDNVPPDSAPPDNASPETSAEPASRDPPG